MSVFDCRSIRRDLRKKASQCGCASQSGLCLLKTADPHHDLSVESIRFLAVCPAIGVLTYNSFLRKAYDFLTN